MRQIKAATVDFSDPQPIVALLQNHAHLADPSQPQAQVAQGDAERDWREAHAAADARCASAFARLKDFATTLQPAVGLQARAAHRIAAHRIASHRIAAHRIAAHRIASHRIAAHRIASHRPSALR